MQLGPGSFFKDSTWSVLARIAMAASRGLGIILISRTLGPEEYGVYAVVLNTVVVMVIVGSLGLEQANTYFSGRHPERLRRLFVVSLLLTGLLGFATVGLFTAVLRVCSGWLFEPRSVGLILEGMLFVPIAILHSQMSGIVIGRSWFRWYASGEFIKWGTYLGILCGLKLAGLLTARSALVAFYISIGIVALLHAGVVHWRAPRTAAADQPSLWGLARMTLSYGWRAFSVNIVNLLNFRFDLYLVKYFRSPAEVGHYSLGVNLAEVLLYLARSINLVIFSRVSSNVARSNTLTPVVSRHVAALVLGISASLLALKDPVILRVFGEAFAASANVMTLMLPGVMVHTVALLLIGDLFGKGELGRVLSSGILCFCVMVILDLMWIPVFGINGAAVASSFAYLAQCVFLLRHHSAGSGQPIGRYMFLTRQEALAAFGRFAGARGRS